MKTYKDIYEQWLNNPIFSKEEKLIIQNYTEEEQKKYFKNKKFSFGTAGVRRKIGLNPQKLNIYTYRGLAKGYAEYIKTVTNNGSVIVAHDNRQNGDKFALVIAEVLEQNGITVYLAPDNISLPTPIVSYLIRKMNLAGGINVTASHNPPNYNGFKTYNSKGCQTNSLEEEIIIQNTPEIFNLFEIEYSQKHNFKFLSQESLKQYFQELTNCLKPYQTTNKSTKVLFSSHNGTSSQSMQTFAHELGFKGFQEFAPECNPLNKLSKNTNPEEIESFANSQKYADENGINYVFSHDPDSDRAAIIEKQPDGSWYSFNGNEMGILYVNFLMQSRKNINNNYIISTFVSGDFIKKIVKDKVKIYLTKTGFKNISLLVEEYEKTGELLLAFEEAIGTLIFPINREKDGFQQSALALNMIGHYQDKNQTLKNVLESLYQKYGYWIGVTDFYFSTDKEWKKIFKNKISELNQHKLGDFFGYQVKEIFFNNFSDSLEWVMTNDSWIKFRISGTEPKFKIYFNLYGKSREEILTNLNKIRDYFKNLLNL